MLNSRPLPAVFHLQFVFERKPSSAQLAWRAFQNCHIVVNGQAVSPDNGRDANWKNLSRAEVFHLLRPGTNDLTVTLWAATGPPALSLRLQTDAGDLETDQHWEVSDAGSLMLPACRAGAIIEPRAGNALFGAETVAHALANNVGTETGFLIAALLMAALANRAFGRADASAPSPRLPQFLIAAAALAWLILLAHNVRWLKVLMGFDAHSHLAYIDFLRSFGRLPRPADGPEMWQPPLYYALAAGLLHWLHGDAASAAGLILLRALNVLVAAANVALVFVGLRLLYPGEWKKQIAGSILAAFLPCHLYLLHYPTNEVLLALGGTATIVVCLKLLLDDAAWRPLWLAGLGAALGAAALTKSSALALAPVVFAALAARLVQRQERSLAGWLRPVVLVFGLATALAGWHYARVLGLGANPLTTNWFQLNQPGWQRPGWTGLSYFFWPGRALVAPYFAGLHGFWDGLYATLWSDSLFGGRLGLEQRPPWNYGLMTVGCVLALAPTCLVLTGAVIRAWLFLRRPTPVWLLLGGVSAIFILALVRMVLVLPYYAHAKAFFALIALLPFCVFALEGFEFWLRRGGRVVGLIFATLCGAWLLNNYAAFWIRPDAFHTRFLWAAAKSYDPDENAAPDLARLAAEAPHDEAVAEALARAELKAGHTNDCEAVAEHALQNNAADGAVTALVATDLARRSHWEEALKLAQSCARQRPDDAVIALTWLELAHATQQDADTVAAGEWLLRDEPGNLEAHTDMADALTRLGQTNAAALHLAILRQKP